MITPPVNIETVTVLFVTKDSVYKQLGVDCYDIDRDARTWPGGSPVVAHPPCRAWGKLRAFAKPRPDEKDLALFAIDLIRQNGGVLEHPKGSGLWPVYLPLPGQRDQYGGYTICVDQSWWGHLARKTTLLYIVGCSQENLPAIPLRLDAIEYTIGSNRRRRGGQYVSRQMKKEVPKKMREATPIEFAIWLIEAAKRCKRQR